MANQNYGHWIGLLASLIGIATPFIPIVREKRYDLAFALLIALLAVGFILRENLYLKKHWRRKKAYAETFRVFNEVSPLLEQLRTIPEPDKAHIRSVFTQASTKIAEGFSIVTGHPCSVAVKIITGDFNQLGYEAGSIHLSGIMQRSVRGPRWYTPAA
ncbi:MAG: hypothetical protein WDO16_24240 [Bacteroidota bacterium]